MITIFNWGINISMTMPLVTLLIYWKLISKNKHGKYIVYDTWIKKHLNKVLEYQNIWSFLKHFHDIQQ